MLPKKMSRLLLATLIVITGLAPLPVAGTAGRGATPAHSPTYRHVMVELDAPPAAHVFAAQQVRAADATAVTAATRAQLARIESQQAAVVAGIAALDAHVLYRVQRVYNGVALRVRADAIPAVRQLEHVVAIHPLIPKTPSNAISVPAIGAPQLWSRPADLGLTGTGITIAVIDTGVDYLHATFGGSRAYGDNDPTIIGDVPNFPGVKVIDGYDFAGDSYDADPENATYNPDPAPDPDPTDCYNHGTHVAATAAGYGVLAPQAGGVAATYRGPYDATTYDRSFAIGPGVAPQANIVALKVFGCRGSSDLTELAIEWAIDPNGDGDFSDRVDVINLSLSSPLGSVDDPTAVASDNAVLTGVIVVASTGNGGDTYFAAGAPAIADRVIAVAASRDHLVQSAAGDADLTVDIATFSARGPRRGDWALKPDIAAPGQAIHSAVAGAPGWDGATYSGTSMAAPHVSGAMALLRQQYPTWRVDELKALVMNTARLPGDSVSPFSPTRTGAGLIDLPATLVAPAIARAANADGRVSVSFPRADVADRHSAVEIVDLTNRSQEPISYTVTYLSVLDTPGVDIAPEQPTVTVAGGATVAVPVRVTAEAAAMRHTRDPNVADTQVFPRHWLSEEAGQLLFWPNSGTLAAALTVTNLGTTLATADQPRAEVRLDPGSGTWVFVLRPGVLDAAAVETAELYIGSARAGDGRRVTAAQDMVAAADRVTGWFVVPPRELPALAQGEFYVAVQFGGTQASEWRGQLGSSSPVLHVPVYAALRPASDVRAQTSVLTYDIDGPSTAALTLHGATSAGTDPPAELITLASVLELQYADLARVHYPERDGQVVPIDHADLKYVGVTSDYTLDPNGPLQDRTLYFGITTYAEWSTPLEVNMSIYVDANEDGIDDYRIFNADARGYNSSTNFSDAFVTVVENLNDGSYSRLLLLNDLASIAFDTRPYGTNVMLLPVRAVDIGLGKNNGDFYYHVETGSIDSIDLVDGTPVLYYDLREPVLDLFAANLHAPIFAVDAPTELTVNLNRDNLAHVGRRELLLLHHHNASGTHDELVRLQLTGWSTLYLPYLTRR